MKKLIIAAAFAASLVTGVEAAPTDAVTQADLKALIERITKLEAENKAQAKRIAELEAADKAAEKKIVATEMKVTEADRKIELQTAKLSKMPVAQSVALDEGTTTNESGRISTPAQGFKYYLADASARIFDPLSESGLRITPYGYLVFEGVYSTRELDGDYTTDVVDPNPQKRNHTTLSMQDSIIGLQFETPEANHGWTFTGRAEIDLVDTSAVHENAYGLHWRHLYINAEHETGWSVLFGQTWHLWKMVTPSEIDGAWMENAGHPYRRSPQVRVTKKWDYLNDQGVKDSSLEVRLGIVKGGPGMGTDRDSDGIQDNTASPWVLFEGAMVYDHVAPWQDDGKRWLIGLGGMYGRERAHRVLGVNGDGYVFGGDEDDYNSMMGMIAASVPFGPFTLTGQFFAGENLGGIQAGVGQRVAYHTYDSIGNEIRTIGGFIDLGYQLNDDWSFAIGWGCDDPVDSDVEGSLSTDGYSGILYNDRAYVAAFYQVTDNFKLGLEYARLLTSYDDNNWYGNGKGGDYDADRVQFSAFYDF